MNTRSSERDLMEEYYVSRSTLRKVFLNWYKKETFPFLYYDLNVFKVILLLCKQDYMVDHYLLTF